MTIEMVVCWKSVWKPRFVVYPMRLRKTMILALSI